MNKNITVTISGPAGVGKTTLALFIQKCLNMFGVDNVVINDSDHTEEEMRHEKLSMGRFEEVLTDKHITVNCIQRFRHAANNVYEVKNNYVQKNSD